MEIVFIAAYIAGFILCIMKGKYGFAALGLLLPIFWLVGAIRLAKPGSSFYRNYSPEKQAIAAIRFPEAAYKEDAKRAKADEYRVTHGS